MQDGRNENQEKRKKQDKEEGEYIGKAKPGHTKGRVCAVIAEHVGDVAVRSENANVAMKARETEEAEYDATHKDPLKVKAKIEDKNVRENYCPATRNFVREEKVAR